MRNRRPLAPFFVILAFGFGNLIHMIDKPSFAAIRTVDVVRLIGTGMCFGAALAMLPMFLRRPRAD